MTRKQFRIREDGRRLPTVSVWDDRAGKWRDYNNITIASMSRLMRLTLMQEIHNFFMCGSVSKHGVVLMIQNYNYK